VIASMRDEAGLVGKIVMVWLLVVALVGVAAVDATSILFTKFRLSDLAVDAANDASNALARDATPTEACSIAADRVMTVDPGAKIAKGGCKIDTTTASVTITLRKTATTIVAGRLSYTEHLAIVTQRETVRPGEL